jgi:hypothetical protein
MIVADATAGTVPPIAAAPPEAGLLTAATDLEADVADSLGSFTTS